MNKIKLVSLTIFLLFWNVFSANTVVPANPQTANNYAQKALAQVAAQKALHKKCDATYGEEIRKRAGDLQKKLMDLMEKERSTALKKRQNNSTIRNMQENFRTLHVKDSIAYRDTSANKIQRRKEAQAERMKAMEKMLAEQRKLDKDPDLAKIRQSIAATQKQIDDTISVIVKGDQTCLECYVRRR